MDGKAILNTYISTHTPLRAQPALRRLHPEVQNFYSHASCEARPGDCSVTVPPDQFLLTRLLRGATTTTTTTTMMISGFTFLLTRLLRGATA